MKVARAATVVLGLAVPVALVAAAPACGARSELLLPGPFQPDFDAGTPIENDVQIVPVEDTGLPGLDVAVRDVVQPSICADASDTLIYTVTTDVQGDAFQLLRFDPSSATFTVIGPLNCPDPFAPFSMAVDRQGNAYVLYYDEAQVSQGPVPAGNIYRVNLNTAACSPTAYVPNQTFQSFGMGFVSNDIGTGETLYVAANNNTTTGSSLGAINETTFAVSDVGLFTPPISQAELTGTGDGRLYAFWSPSGPDTAGSAIAQIDKATAQVIGQANLPEVTQGGGWAFAFWGGDFYLFTNPGGVTAGGSTESIVQRYDPVANTVATIASYPLTIVGAGVSTCAPVQ